MAEEGLIIKIFADAKDFISGASKAAQEAKSKFKGIGDELSKELKRVDTVGTTAFKGITGAIAGGAAAVTAAVGSLAKSAIDSFANYEQLKGGVETLFKDSADLILNYASRAYETAGVSANKYMETVTSFSASLLQSLGGDTEKAAKYAHRAMVDMSDNANKMGTSIESIQNAYQGFAKQNYTMLDNLKLGYGGTKEEMERLIKDAANLTDIQKELGITVDANSMSFGNIVNAISVVQKQMGIAGTTSEEAATTISGSINMMSAAWENLKTNLLQGEIPLDEAINDFVWSVTKVIDNLGPAIQKSLEGIGKLIEKALPTLLEFGVPAMIESVIPGIGKAAIAIVETLGNELNKNIGKLADFVSDTIPGVIEIGVKLVKSILEGITNNISSITESGHNIITSLLDGIRAIMPNVLEIARSIVGTIAEGFIEYKALIMEMGVQIITTLAQGLADASPTLGPKIVDLVTMLIGMLVENMPALLEAAITIITNIANAVVEKLPELLGKITTLVYNLMNQLLDTIGTWGPALLKIVASIVAAVIAALVAALISIGQHLAKWWNSSLKPWFDNLWKNIKNWFDNLKTSGKAKLTEVRVIINDFLSWAKNEIKSKVDDIKTAVKTKVSDIKTDISTKITDIKTAISEKVTAIKQNISDKLAAIKTGISEKVSSIKTTVTEKVQSIVETIKTTFENLPGHMLEIGKNIVEGIWNGIGDAKAWLEGKISDLVGDITGWFKNLLGINSPSKVFAELGGYLTEGLAVGLEDETDMLKLTAKKQIDQLTGIYDQVDLGSPRLALAGNMAALSRMGQNVQNVTNDNGNVFNFGDVIVNGTGADAGDDMFRQFQRRVRYSGGVL